MRAGLLVCLLGVACFSCVRAVLSLAGKVWSLQLPVVVVCTCALNDMNERQHRSLGFAQSREAASSFFAPAHMALLYRRWWGAD